MSALVNYLSDILSGLAMMLLLAFMVSVLLLFIIIPVVLYFWLGLLYASIITVFAYAPIVAKLFEGTELSFIPRGK